MGKLEITKNDLKKRFAEYNDLYFQNKLKMPLFKFIMAKSLMAVAMWIRNGVRYG